MMAWFKSLFAWRAVRSTGVWLYRENAVTGRRQALKISACWGPLDHAFIRAGDEVFGPRGRYVVGRESEIIFG